MSIIKFSGDAKRNWYFCHKHIFFFGITKLFTWIKIYWGNSYNFYKKKKYLESPENFCNRHAMFWRRKKKEKKEKEKRAHF